MRNATELLTQYAGYHRDQRNIATHFVGIPLIVFAVGILAARPAVNIGDGIELTPAWTAWAVSALWYLTRGNLTLGLATTAVNGVLIALAQPLAGGSTFSWLVWGIGAFAMGWTIQFIGHYYEGRKPAFVDDLVGLLVGPMFVVAEGLFSLGWGKSLMAEIERRVGPTHLRDLAAVRG